MDIQLRINEIELQPGANIDPALLKESNFSKTGLVKRLIKRLPKGQAMYTAENCTIDCFDDQLNLYPCTHGYLNKDRQWQTRASILLVQGQIKKIEFHVLEGVYAAPNFIETFRTLCNESFGNPEKLQPNYLLWKNNHLSFTSLLHPDSVNADFCIEILD